MFLLERTGDISSALDLLMKTFHSNLITFYRAQIDRYGKEVSAELSEAEEDLHQNLKEAVALTRRNSERLIEDDVVVCLIYHHPPIVLP